MKLSFLPILFAALVLTSACEEQTDEEKDNANISKFFLVNDSIDGVEYIQFIVNNTENTIYNADSATFGMRVDSVFPYIVGATALEEIIINDSILYILKDTFYMDFTKPVKIKTLAPNKKTEKEYTVSVIVHQVNPDTFLWSGVNSQIYTEIPVQEHSLIFLEKIYLFTRTATSITCLTSDDAAKWTNNPTTGLPVNADIKRIVSGENAIYYSDGTSLYTSEDGAAWTVKAAAEVKHLLFCMRGKVYAQKGDMPGATLVALPEVGEATWTEITKLHTEFPQTGMTVCVADAPNKSVRVFVLGGRDNDGKLLKSLWSSDNGSYWADLTIGKEPFTPREEAAMTQYADGLMIFGGKDKDGLCTDRLIFSADHGLTWAPVDSIAMMPYDCVDRYSASMLTNSLGYIYVIGGKVDENTYIKNAWRGLRYASLPGFKN